MPKISCGFCLCGSFCTFDRAIAALSLLVERYDVYPIMSFNAYSTDTRFGKAEEHIERIEALCKRRVMHSLVDVEPIGPRSLLDILVVCPCTGNTLAKLAQGIADTPVTLAVKSHLRNLRPVVIAVSTNDALSAAAKNIGELHNRKNIFFVPYKQDDSQRKPCSIVADFSQLLPAVRAASEGRQLQPVLL